MKSAAKGIQWTRQPLTLAGCLSRLPAREGFSATALPDVFLMRSTKTYPYGAVSYEPSIVLIAQGRKQGRLGGRLFRYDARNDLVLSRPLPFECQTIGTPDEPMLGLSIRVDPATVAELLLKMDALPPTSGGSPNAIDAIPVTPALGDAALRLARSLLSPADAAILGPQTVREITYHALLGGQGASLRALVTPQSTLGQIARALRRIHADYAAALDVGLLAREAGMSVSTFHAKFKAVTAKPPLHYLQTIRLHKARVFLVAGETVGGASRRVGYESASQFSREFKRLFGGTPKEVATRNRAALAAA
jgi:AraC-like DNA-binding protein